MNLKRIKNNNPNHDSNLIYGGGTTCKGILAPCAMHLRSLDSLDQISNCNKFCRRQLFECVVRDFLWVCYQSGFLFWFRASNRVLIANYIICCFYDPTTTEHLLDSGRVRLGWGLFHIRSDSDSQAIRYNVAVCGKLVGRGPWVTSSCWTSITSPVQH